MTDIPLESEDPPWAGMFDGVEFNATGEPIPEVGEPLEEEHPFGDVTQPIGDGKCVVCGEATFRPPGLTKAGHKKRTPKYCDLHARNVSIPSTGSGTQGMESQLLRIQEELADDVRLLATLAGPLLPVTGMYLLEQADPFTIALLKLAKNNTKVLRVLHRAAQVAPVYTVAQTLAGTAYAVQVDTRNADAHNTIAKRLGVERAYNLINEQEYQQEEPQTFSGPPKYSVVQ